MAEVAAAWWLLQESICSSGINDGVGGYCCSRMGLRIPSTYGKLSTLDIEE